MSAENEITVEECEETHPGFEVKCKSCGSTRVIFENTMGWSALSGGWGSADLECLDCGHSTELVVSG